MRPLRWLGYVVLYLLAAAGADVFLFPRVPHREGAGWWIALAGVLVFLLLTPSLGEWLHRQAQGLPVPSESRRRWTAWLETSMIAVLAVAAGNLLVALMGTPDLAETLLVLGFFLVLWRLRRWLA